MSAAASLCEQLSLARGSALRGDYATAEVFYQGVAAQITRCVGHCRVQAWSRASLLLAGAHSLNRHVRGLEEPHLKKQWLRLRGLVAEELEVTAALQAAAGPGEGGRQATAAAVRSHFTLRNTPNLTCVDRLHGLSSCCVPGTTGAVHGRSCSAASWGAPWPVSRRACDHSAFRLLKQANTTHADLAATHRWFRRPRLLSSLAVCPATCGPCPPQLRAPLPPRAAPHAHPAHAPSPG